MKKALILSGLLATLYGCGGGGLSTGLDIPIGGGGGGVGGSSHVSLEFLGVSKSSVNAGESFTVSWQVSFSSITNSYFVMAYLNTSPELPASEGDYMFYRNCGSSIYGCGSTGSISCDYRINSYGDAVVSCGRSNYRVPFLGKGYLILKACVYGNSMQKICDVKSVPITLN